MQDNKSAILLETNGRSSSGQKTRHIDIRYFFLQDRMISELLSVEYCPTECMLADFFTKPLQGSLFRKFRDVLLGYQHIDTLRRISTSPPQTVDLDSIPVELSTSPLIEERVEQSVVCTDEDTGYTTVIKKRRRGKTAIVTAVG